MTRISQGSVSNITTEWKTDLGYPEPDDLRDLEDIGFGLPQLRIFQDTIHEVARANKISNYLAFEKFLNEILKNHEPKSGHERRIHSLTSEIEKKKSDLIVLTTALGSKKEVAKVLGQLFYIGLQDKQI